MRLGGKAYFSKKTILEKLYFEALKDNRLIYSLGGCILVFNNKKIFIYREYNDLYKKTQVLPGYNTLIWDNRFQIINNTNKPIKVLAVGSILNNSYYKRTFKMNKKIIFSGGGTGGHIFPAINLMKHFFEKGYKVILVTDERGNNFIKNYSEFKSYILKAGTPTNKNLLKKFFSFFLIFYSIVKSILILKKEKPNLILDWGGMFLFQFLLHLDFLIFL